jgi:hypothetical protein
MAFCPSLCLWMSNRGQNSDSIASHDRKVQLQTRSFTHSNILIFTTTSMQFYFAIIMDGEVAEASHTRFK